MYKSISCIAFVCLAAAVSAGLIEAHHVVEEPVLAKVAAVVHSAPSAVSHQSFTRYHNKAVVSPIVAAVVRTSVHEHPAVSYVKSAPIVQTYAAAPEVHSVPVLHATPVVHAGPAVSVINTDSIVHTHSLPLVHAARAAAYAFHH